VTIATYISIPIIAALIGWLTNWIAVRMIFRPRAPIRILGLTFLGLIPKRKSDLARKIGATVEKELISHQDIQKVVERPEFSESLLNTIMLKIDERIANLIGSNQLLAMLFSGHAAGNVKAAVRGELEKQLPGILESMFEKMESNLDFKEIVRTKIENFDLLKLESIIYGIAARELRAIELYGGVLGFLFGLAQVGILIAGIGS
jgi:uncharacterized membrane protein YheB (UPF0754 family)